MPKFNLGGFIKGPAYGVLNEYIGEFRSKDGYALPSRYELEITPPDGDFTKPKGGNKNLASLLMPQQKSEGLVRDTGLRCESIEFPGRNLDTTADINLYGPERNIVTGYSYADITGVFQMSNDFREKKFFETWQKLAFNSQAWNMEYYYNYVGKLTISQLDTEDRKSYGIEIMDCFPKTIAAQSASYTPATEIQKLSVTFAYRYWKNMEIDATDIPLPDRLREVVGEGVERAIRNRIPKVLSKL